MIYIVERLDAWGDWNEIYRGIEKEAAKKYRDKVKRNTRCEIRITPKE